MISKKRLKKQAYNFMYALNRELKKFNHKVNCIDFEKNHIYFEIDNENSAYVAYLKIDDKGLTEEFDFMYVNIIIESVEELASMIDDIIDKIKSRYDFCENCNDYFHEEYEPCECVYDDYGAYFTEKECNALWREINRF